ncbi:3-keto-disaccharide hydrolase [Dyadobacter psychrotolerans]|uniref:DUF1080 domain-containing protein n=1 Tax=Dyadobacter psychrotolerans TaxID=2541721 RepID=A0A4R5DMC4_9BACT|nr:DUF1080 domain-containing protein [Dyadobacter psychrotolerans]TDE15426.1 DUF1080 domain-containing protein [Dyadobacter psychrotolerans]
MNRNFSFFYAPFFFLIMAGLTAFTSKPVSLFNGKNFDGWQGDTLTIWRIEDGAIVSGSLSENLAHNCFLSTKKSYSDFVLKLKFKLTGTEGFVNAGVQFNSKRAVNPDYEMIGYQADLGEKYWASLYDESRRNKTLSNPDYVLISNILKRDTWNDYQIRSENGHIRLYLNGKLTVDYTEKDKSIPQEGLIALQIHGGGKAIVAYKDITIEELW